MALIYYSKHNNQGIMFISNAYISNISSQAVIFSIKKTKYQLVNGAAYGGVWGGTTPPLQCLLYHLQYVITCTCSAGIKMALSAAL